MKIDVVFNQTKTYNGIKKYYTSLIEGLNSKGNSVNPIALKKYEITIKGRLYGGWQSENFFTLLSIIWISISIFSGNRIHFPFFICSF